MSGFKFESEIKPEPRPAKQEKKPKALPVKIDPRYLKAARELRDRYLEHVNENGGLLPSGKYDVSKILGDAAEGARALPETLSSHLLVA